MNDKVVRIPGRLWPALEELGRERLRQIARNGEIFNRARDHRAPDEEAAKPTAIFRMKARRAVCGGGRGDGPHRYAHGDGDYNIYMGEHGQILMINDDASQIKSNRFRSCH